MPASGELDQLVTIEQETRTPNGQGGYTTSWSALPPKAWAKIVGLSGNEAVAANIQRAVQQWRVHIRRRNDVQPKHRIMWGSLVLDIKAAMPDPKEPNAFTLLICESGAVA